MMQESSALDQRDLELVHALQINPRASWQLVGSVLGMDPATAGRRWARLVEHGWAWVSTSPTPLLAGPMCVALVELDCAPGGIRESAEMISRDSEALTIEHIAGGCDLLVVVVTTDLAQMSEYIHGRLGRMRGVTGVRSNIVTHLLAEGGGWHLDVLAPAQQSRLLREMRNPEPRVKPLTSTDYSLLRALNTTGRATTAELAEQLSISPATVRRRIDTLTVAGYLALRCEFARSQVGWPATAIYWGTAPAADLAGIGAQLRRRPETRTCLALAGPRNVWLVSYLHSIADSPRLEAELSQTIPELVINDRAIVYHTIKQYGHVLDTEGRRVTTIPIAGMLG
ncbi:Lrp/AsnC family transcriptional regulator [Nocardia sp. FBN12]|uniref:Lrp/AsnC family transcriptional regulator n=1 Tax=Nocardia sp. FBN12 TaxID=3419766 RepID=UPI003CFF41B8